MVLSIISNIHLLVSNSKLIIALRLISNDFDKQLIEWLIQNGY